MSSISSPLPTLLSARESGVVRAVPAQDWQKLVEDYVRGLKFGSVSITVHEGRVVQVETCSKVRFDKSA